MMTNEDHQAFKALDETAIHRKVATLERCAMELCTLGYDVTINFENSIDENDFELIIRKRLTA
jgi:regulator of RNase E activity RraB